MSEYKCSGLRAVVPIPPARGSTSVEIKEAHEETRPARASFSLLSLEC
jgi:hypothetical protein